MGEDLDGVLMKLSDFRGKVVLLSFWGTWCGPCMAMIPHERELSETFKKQPFAIVGVNSDEKDEELKTAITKHNITWRSFWCGPKGADGPIPTTWNVTGWPTVIVIDHTGVIRARQLRGKALELRISELVKAIDRPIAK